MRRLHQIRGNSLLAGVLMRLSALKEYEDAELTAARIAAALGMFIKKVMARLMTKAVAVTGAKHRARHCLTIFARVKTSA
jgi:capsid protein